MERIKSLHECDEEIHVDPKPKFPNVDRDLQLAKRYLQSYGDDNETLWNHLVEVIHKIMVSKKGITPGELHNICRRLRERKLFIHDWMVDIYQDKLFLCRAIELISLYKRPNYKWNWEERTPDSYKTLDDKFMQKMRMKRGMGFCIPEREVYAVLMSMRSLADNLKVAKITFWGKIFGISRDYYIVECDIDQAELDLMHAEEQEKINQETARLEAERIEKERLEREEEERLKKEEKARKEKEKRDKVKEKRKEKERIKQEKIDKMERIKQRKIELAKKLGRSLGEIGEDILAGEVPGEGKPKKKEKSQEEEVKIEDLLPPPPVSLFNTYVMPKLPQTRPRITIEIPSEPYGEGLNKKEYYVCNDLGDPWVKLPDVTPIQIQIARRIKKFLTGDLEAEVTSMPQFPGKEKNYLRAMIARISASTEISPVGYYTGGGEEGGGGFGEGGAAEAVINPEFHGVAWQQLFDTSQAFWSHNQHYILPQGRLKWWKPPKIVDEDELGGEDEQGGEGDEILPERGPPILTTVSKDHSNEVERCWSIMPSSVLFKTGVTVMARSNLWPGATATMLEFSYKYLYIGWGLKFSQYGYTPPFVPPPAEEYEIGPEILEILDPTPEEEEAWRIAHMPKEKKGEGGEGGGGEGGEVRKEEEDEEEEEEE